MDLAAVLTVPPIAQNAEVQNLWTASFQLMVSVLTQSPRPLLPVKLNTASTATSLVTALDAATNSCAQTPALALHAPVVVAPSAQLQLQTAQNASMDTHLTVPAALSAQKVAKTAKLMVTAPSALQATTSPTANAFNTLAPITASTAMLTKFALLAHQPIT